jgi:hypothetical protein
MQHRAHELKEREAMEKINRSRAINQEQRRVIGLDEAPEPDETTELDEETLKRIAGGRNGTHQSQQGREWGWW